MNSKQPLSLFPLFPPSLWPRPRQSPLSCAARYITANFFVLCRYTCEGVGQSGAPVALESREFPARNPVRGAASGPAERPTVVFNTHTHTHTVLYRTGCLLCYFMLDIPPPPIIIIIKGWAAWCRACKYTTAACLLIATSACLLYMHKLVIHNSAKGIKVFLMERGGSRCAQRLMGALSGGGEHCARAAL